MRKTCDVLPFRDNWSLDLDVDCWHCASQDLLLADQKPTSAACQELMRELGQLD